MRVLFAAGTQFPFPRLDQVVLSVAHERPDWPLVYQAGPGAALEPFKTLANLVVQPLFDAEHYQRLFGEAELVVTHAGMGNILACLEQSKPFLMMPRRASLGEHRNDHQQDTAEAISARYGIPTFSAIEPLVEAILGRQGKALHTHEVREAIESERREFAKRLNSLVSSL
ncbi:hypothetical protein Q427_23770 [Halomonas sp. BC04]|nr:hypothetical protein Q427_23770 [Halomonas sp. BC04]